MKNNIFSKNIAPDPFAKSIRQQTNITNFNRVTYFFIAMLFIEPLLILFNDISGLINGPFESWLYYFYLCLHSILLLIAIFWILFRKTLSAKCADWDALIPVTISVILVLLSLINGLDQLHNDSINVYITNLLMACVALLIAFPTNLYVLFPPYVIFVAGLFIFQNNEASRFNSLINGSIFFIAVVVISTYLYRYYFENSLQNLELTQANEKLNYMSAHDGLTGLLNRKEFENRLLQMQANKRIALILLDIDHFKLVNDTYGHLAGDQVLIQVAKTLKESVPDLFIVSRWGGEEFQIAGPVENLTEATEIAETIRIHIENLSLASEQGQIRFTSSFGVTLISSQFGNHLDTCFKRADDALYLAKSNGRNRVEMA
ncbi:GGDEF domain-containing protein [Eubacteriaceae bacterium ES3]|nr:GGDEF domain-containing protein [Eubacteriaceae bacterium ES3]